MKPIQYCCLIIILALVTAADCWAAPTGHKLLRKQADQAFHLYVRIFPDALRAWRAVRLPGGRVRHAGGNGKDDG